MLKEEELVYMSGETAEKGDCENLRKLLKKGVSSRVKDYAIRWASQTGKKEAVSILLEEGANPNAGLIFAVAYNQPEILQQLIKAGADVNLYDAEAVKWAIKRGYAGILKILFDAGAKPNKHDALKLAKKYGDKNIIELIEENLA